MTTYATLRTDLQNYSARGDVTQPLAESFIRVAESMVNRKARTRSQETSTTLTFSTNTAALPSDYRALISLTPQDEGVWDYLPPSKLREAVIWTSTWVAGGNAAYTIEGDNVVIAPAPSGSPVADLLYYAAYAALSDSNTTNWLLTNHYEAYLYSALSSLYDYFEDSEQEMKYQQKFEKVLMEVNQEAERGRRGDTGLRRTGTSTP